MCFFLRVASIFQTDALEPVSDKIGVNSPILRNFTTITRLEARYNTVMSRPAIEIDALNVEERLELIESLWESLIVDPSNVPITDAQRQMLDERLDEIEAGDDAGAPWEEVRDRILKRLS